MDKKIKKNKMAWKKYNKTYYRIDQVVILWLCSTIMQELYIIFL